MNVRSVLVCAWAVLVAATGIAKADGNSGHYVDLDHLDLVTFIPPAPAKGSRAEAEDLATVLKEQQGRKTAEMIYERFSFLRYAKGLNWQWQPEQLSTETKALFDRLNDDVQVAAAKAKRRINRPRPFVLSTKVEWAGRTKASSSANGGKQAEAIIGSYPSGHSAKAYAAAFVLAAMVPEKVDEIFTRADTVAWEPVIGGSHFPTDSTTGARTAAGVLFYAATQNPTFKSDYQKARAEIRAALKLTDQAK
ncbi:phosphatase PAP2 family protein [Steroidobacter sp.]|uniref:phosphatase PAP2 family protein n=1 Tax=Steroidobacter sp. TaxID=1978227 RepID=UPI001A44965B|nr:phosphatase PAP2 family protein [Steroidobacter sp.]MBL8270030.1 phosphatase PAP2 family protein [Steroidobacter sp.]